MKITTRPRNSGHIFFVLVLLIAIVAIIWVGYKIIDHLQKNPPDPTHGYGTNDLDVTSIDPAFVGIMASLREQLPPNSVVSITATQINATITVPLEALAYRWHYRILTSSNMIDWTPTDLKWDEDLAMMKTNHSEPARFYWRQLIY